MISLNLKVSKLQPISVVKSYSHASPVSNYTSKLLVSIAMSEFDRNSSLLSSSGMISKMTDKEKHKSNSNTVFLAKHKTTGEEFCMKIEKRKYRAAWEDISEGGDLILAIKSANIIRVRYIINTKTKKYIIYDYLPWGRFYCHLQPQKELDEERVKFYAREIILGKSRSPMDILLTSK